MRACGWVGPCVRVCVWVCVGGWVGGGGRSSPSRDDVFREDLLSRRVLSVDTPS